MNSMIMASYKIFYLYIICNVCCELYPFYQSEAASVPPTNTTASQGKGGISSETIVAILVPISVAILILMVGICCFNKRTRKKYDSDAEEPTAVGISNVDSLHYDFCTIEAATNNFSADNKIGSGGFGEVYKGVLPDGQEIAMRRLRKTRSSRRGIEEFKKAIKEHAKLQHRNLVTLLGFSVQGDEKILVFEYMPNRSLNDILFDPKKKKQLDWAKRYKIIKGIVQCIKHLHEESRFKIMHSMIGVNNILLDNDMNPKIKDFDLTIINADYAPEIRGDIAPGQFYGNPGEYYTKCDAYRFGVLLIEIISGKRNSFWYQIKDEEEHMLSYAWRLWNEGEPLELVDPTIKESCNPNEVMRCIHIALLCVQDDPADRPSMSSIVIMLHIDSLTLPSPLDPLNSFKKLYKEKKTNFPPRA